MANPVPFFFHFVTIHMILKILSLFGMELQKKKKQKKKKRKKERKKESKKGRNEERGYTLDERR